MCLHSAVRLFSNVPLDLQIIFYKLALPLSHKAIKKAITVDTFSCLLNITLCSSLTDTRHRTSRFVFDCHSQDSILVVDASKSCIDQNTSLHLSNKPRGVKRDDFGNRATKHPRDFSTNQSNQLNGTFPLASTLV